MRIAVIGAGVSGLTAAYFLCRRHDVTVFEAADSVGGHAQTVRVPGPGREVAIDTGFVVYNETNYPLFTGLLRELDVETQPTSMGFSVRSDLSGIEYNGSSVDGLFSQRRNVLRPRFLRMLGDIARFQIEAPALAKSLPLDTSVESFLSSGGYGPGFVDDYLLPLGSALWSVPAVRFWAFPIRFVIEFLDNHGMLRWSRRPQWRVIRGGCSRYVERLSRPFSGSTHLNSPVRAVERRKDCVRVVDGSGASGSFDHAVLACHADQSLQMLTDASRTETDILSSFPYQSNEGLLHTDPEPLPRRRRAWASWNYRVRRRSGRHATVTYNMNRLQGIPGQTQFNLTLNDAAGIDERKVLRRLRYEHPVFAASRATAQARHPEMIGARRTSYCGAYWGYGFHEDGVRSAVSVCRALDPETVQ